MKSGGKKGMIWGIALLLVFILWTILIQCMDVQPVGQNGTNIGFASVNVWFHQLTGVNMTTKQGLNCWKIGAFTSTAPLRMLYL